MAKRKNYIILGIIIIPLIITVVFTSIKEEPKEISINLIEYTASSDETEKNDFSDFVKISTNGFVGEFVKYREYEDTIEFVFKIKETLYGNFTDEKSVKVRAVKTNMSSSGSVNIYSYKEGHEYLLLLHKGNVTSDYPKYQLCGLTVLDLSDTQNAKWAHGYLEITKNANKTDIIHYV